MSIEEASSLFVEDRWEEALSAFSVAVEARKHSEDKLLHARALAGRAACHLKLGHVDFAIADARSALELNGDSLAAHHLLG
jgi:tetratricopeptide (TPR) repeat protein